MFDLADEPLLLDFSIPIFRDSDPLQIAAFEPGNPVPVRQFTDLGDWRNHVLKLRLSSAVLKAIRDKHDQVLRTLFMAWFHPDVVKLAELGALAVLERGIRMRYSTRKFKAGLTFPLRYLLECGGVRDEDLRTYPGAGVGVVQNLLRACKERSRESLCEIRNRLAHGDPFEITPWAGLFEAQGKLKPGLGRGKPRPYRFAPKASRRPSQSFTTNSCVCLPIQRRHAT